MISAAPRRPWVARAGSAAALAVALAATASAAHAAGAADGPPVLAPDASVVVPARPSSEGTRAEEDRVVQLGLPSPSRYGVGTPARAAAEWLSAWRQRAWSRMRLWSTPTPRRPEGADDLRARLWVARLDGWALQQVTERGGTARAVVLAALHPALRMRERRVRLPLTLRRGGGVWQVRADAFVTPVAGALR